MRKIVITGGAGFIGTHLAEVLSNDNNVILYDNFHRNALQYAPHLSDNPHVTCIKGDVLNIESIESALAGADIVLHLAAIAGVSSYYTQSLKTLEVNILGTYNVLSAASRLGVERFIDFSTSEVYGPHAMNVNEESLHGIGPVSDPRWVYATSKLASEHFTLRFGETTKMHCTAVRPFNIYGPRQIGEGAISNFCRAALLGKPLEVYGDGTPLRAWCYIDDFVNGIILILDKKETYGLTFNIGNPTEVETTLGLARRIARLHGCAKLVQKNIERAEVQSRVPDITRAKKILGYQPEIDLDEGVKRTLAWFETVKESLL